MFCMFYRLADTIITANENSDGSFSCEFSDNLTGKLNEKKLTNVQLGAIVALALAGEDYQPELTKLLYEIAEPAVADFEPEVRPIP